MSMREGRKASKDRVKAGVTKVGEKMMGRKRGRVFYNFVRRRVSRELVRKHGYSWEAAQDEVDELSDEEIDAKADEAKIEGPRMTGKFLDWLKANGPAIMEFIMMIVKLLMMFAEKPKKKNAEEEADNSDIPEDIAEDDDD